MTKLTPVETVGCKVQDAESPLALDHGWFTSYISTFSFCICLSLLIIVTTVIISYLG